MPLEGEKVCSICPSSENLEIDHEIPRALVGETSPIKYLWKACHESKTSDEQEAGLDLWSSSRFCSIQG